MVDTKKEYSISEVSELTGYENHVLRYYEKEFDLDIPRNNANHRYYTYKEIESFNYIKSLQEKGFTNKQIKLIINSPEVLINEQQEETAVSSLATNEVDVTTINEIASSLTDIVVSEMRTKLSEKEDNSIKAIHELKREIGEVKQEIRSKERDILITENAKLKMKVKEKSYELAELKEKLKREKDSNKGFFKRFF